MTTLKDKIMDAGLADRILTEIDLNNLLDGTPASRHGMVNKALKKQELIKVRRGLYLLADKYRHNKISKFFLASRIAPHSYISFESALSFHGWIPERVSVITSVLTCGRSKEFINIFGEFTYYRLPINEYEFLTNVTRVEEIKGQPFLIASPLRALADLVYVKKIDWEGIKLLTDGLRIDKEYLLRINLEEFINLQKIYRSTRVLDFLNYLKKELKK